MTIDLDDELKKDLDIFCATIQRKKVDVIREWIREKLDDAKKQNMNPKK